MSDARIGPIVGECCHDALGQYQTLQSAQWSKASGIVDLLGWGVSGSSGGDHDFAQQLLAAGQDEPRADAS